MKSLKIIKEEENLKHFVPLNLKLFCTTKKGTKIMCRYQCHIKMGEAFYSIKIAMAKYLSTTFYQHQEL